MILSLYIYDYDKAVCKQYAIVEVMKSGHDFLVRKIDISAHLFVKPTYQSFHVFQS